MNFLDVEFKSSYSKAIDDLEDRVLLTHAMVKR